MNCKWKNKSGQRLRNNNAGEDRHEHGIELPTHIKINNTISVVILKLDKVLYVRLEVKPKSI